MPPKGNKVRGKKTPKGKGPPTGGRVPQGAVRRPAAAGRRMTVGPRQGRSRAPKSGLGSRFPRRTGVGWSQEPAANAARMGPITSSAPSSIGTTFPRSFFGFAGAAQHLTDQDPEQSVRVTGRDLFDLPIRSGSASAAAGFGGTGTYYALVAPIEISARLANLEEMFLFYAIRHLRVFYAPATASTSTTQIALGYTTELEVVNASLPTPTQTQVMEMEASVLSSAWQPFCFEMKHEGTRLYLTSFGSEDPPQDVEYQGALACTLLNGVESTTYGQLWVEYVVDFYKPTPLLSDPTWELAFGSASGRSRGFRRPRAPPRSSDLLRDESRRSRPLLRSKVAFGASSVSPPELKAPSIPGGAAAAAATPLGRWVVVNSEDELVAHAGERPWEPPAPPRFTPAPSVAPGTPGYVPPTPSKKVPSTK